MKDAVAAVSAALSGLMILLVPAVDANRNIARCVIDLSGGGVTVPSIRPPLLILT